MCEVKGTLLEHISEEATHSSNWTCQRISQAQDNQASDYQLSWQVFGDATLGGAAELAEVVDTIFLSVKPQYLDRVIESLKPHVKERHLIVSIAAGVRIASLEANLPGGTRVVRF